MSDRTITPGFFTALYDTLANPPGWMEQGLCVYDDTEDIASLCEDCPVKTQCYNHGVSHGVTSGVLGGVDFAKESK